MNIAAFEPFRREILASRESGTITCALRPRDAGAALPGVEEITAFANSLGFKAAPKVWRPVSREAAASILTRILAADLAYGSAELPIARARFLSDRFLELLAEPSLHLTNGLFSAKSPYGVSLDSWSPITGSTFDTGIACGDRSMLAIAWAEDED